MSLTEKTNNKGNKVVVSIAEDSNLVSRNTPKSIEDILKEQRSRKNSDDAWSTEPDYVNDLASMLVSSQRLEANIEAPEKKYAASSLINDCISGKKWMSKLFITDRSHLGIYPLEDKLRYTRLLVEFIIEKYVTSYMGLCKKSANDMEVYTGVEVHTLHDIDLASSLDIKMKPYGSFHVCEVDVTFITNGGTNNSDKCCLNFVYDIKDFARSDIFVELNDEVVRVLEKMFED